ncbi:MAG: Asp-tRNA(Asn)/Glu-tRNA(Gln) amidotransferase subunit GatC [Gemmataceae bacterium]
MSITPEEVLWVAKLSRLHLSEEEQRKMTEQLTKIVDYVDQLQEVDTENVEPLDHPLAIQNVFREDEPKTSLKVEEALANAPKQAKKHFSVPAVIDG